MNSFMESPASFPIKDRNRLIYVSSVASAVRSKRRRYTPYFTRGKRQNALNENWSSGQQQQQQYASSPHPESFVPGSSSQRSPSTNRNSNPELARTRDSYVQGLQKDTAKPSSIASNAIGNGAQRPQRNVKSISKSPLKEEKVAEKVIDSTGFPSLASSQKYAVFTGKAKEKSGMQKFTKLAENKPILRFARDVAE